MPSDWAYCLLDLCLIEEKEQNKGSHKWRQQLTQWKATLEKDVYLSSNTHLSYG